MSSPEEGRLHKEGAEEAYTRRIMVRANIDDSTRPWSRESVGVEGLDRPVAPDHSEDDRSEQAVAASPVGDDGVGAGAREPPRPGRLAP